VSEPGSLLTIFAAAAAGALLGLLFFQGLWITIRNLQSVRHPAILMLGSMLLRFSALLGGFYLLARYGDWSHLLAAAAGLTLVRILLLRRKPPDLEQEQKS
jgi:F1F0 ATPase subunit 2